MITSRLALAQVTRSHGGIVAASVSSALRSSSSLTSYEAAAQEMEELKSATQRKMEAMTKVDPWMVYGSTDPDPAPRLPDNPAEIAALDIAQRVDFVQPDGTTRIVHIRQDEWKPGQNPQTSEKRWLISFMDEGTTATQNWINPLMGWVSGSDPMASNIQLQLQFDSATEAAYFAKKRGWQFVVDKPIFREMRSDAVQYQDNFLPQIIASDIQRNKTQCKQWERTAAGTSHYQRPLKYHGDGEVPQYGPNGNAPVEKHVEGYYKMR